MSKQYPWKRTLPEVGIWESLYLNCKYLGYMTPQQFCWEGRGRIRRTRSAGLLSGDATLLEYLRFWLQVKDYARRYYRIGFVSSLEDAHGCLCGFTNEAMRPIKRVLSRRHGGPLTAYIGGAAVGPLPKNELELNLGSFTESRERFVRVLISGLDGSNPEIQGKYVYQLGCVRDYDFTLKGKFNLETQYWLDELIHIWQSEE